MSTRRSRSGSEGEAEGVVDTKLTVRNMIEQLDNQLKLKPEESPYWGRQGFPGVDQRGRPGAADAAIRDSITATIYPALPACTTS